MCIRSGCSRCLSSHSQKSYDQFSACGRVIISQAIPAPKVFERNFIVCIADFRQPFLFTYSIIYGLAFFCFLSEIGITKRDLYDLTDFESLVQFNLVKRSYMLWMYTIQAPY